MITLYVFNPEHDIALANGDPNFVPPAHVIDFANRDAMLLPTANGGLKDNSFVVVDKTKVTEVHPAHVDWSELAELPIEKVEVWGWDEAVCQKLRKAGVSEALFPSKEELQRIKELSHRSLAKQANDFIGQHLPRLYHPSEELRSFAEVEGFVTKNNNVVLKSPYSGSGRGLRWCRGTFSHSDQGWIKNTLEKQGSVMGEPRRYIVLDFATLFCCPKGGSEVEFKGYSLFETKNGAYQRNIILSDSEIEDSICKYVDTELLKESIDLIRHFLTDNFIERYVGPIGVDMAICRSEAAGTGGVAGTYTLWPVVEINVRYTMGFVARNSLATGRAYSGL